MTTKPRTLQQILDCVNGMRCTERDDNNARLLIREAHALGAASASPDEGRAGPTMAMLLDGFDAEIERRSAQLSAPKGGQSVSPSGDFVSAVPSVLRALRWWSRAFREALPALRPSSGDAP